MTIELSPSLTKTKCGTTVIKAPTYAEILQHFREFGASIYSKKENAENEQIYVIFAQAIFDANKTLSSHSRSRRLNLR